MLFSYKKIVRVHKDHLDVESGSLTEREKETLSEKLDSKKVEPFTADEALDKSLDNPRYELLKNEIFREINKAIEKGYGRIKFKEYFSVDDVNSERLKNYFIALGYKAWLADSEVHFNGESVLFLNISWIDIDEVTGEMKL